MKKLFFALLVLLCLVSCDNLNTDEPTDSETPVTPETPVTEGTAPETSTTVYLVGDSTVCSFSDTSYYYPRYGYGTQLSNYFYSQATFNNLALSGRSSISYITEANYATLSSSLKAGDYLLIGFGHNDEKSDDATRYSEPLGSKETVGSFKYNLYTYYIQLAVTKGATPILCTPIVRASSSSDYSGSNGHVTNGADYSEVIKALGTETGTQVIDLTAQTKALYTDIGYNNAIKYHAWTSSNASSVDNTHLNIYGAKNVAYMIATTLKNSTCGLSSYVLPNIAEPTEADRVTNPNYVESAYSAPALASYTAPDFYSTITNGWYGTAFGDTGGSPSSSSNGFIAKETAALTFQVGQTASSSKGKITTTEGIAFAFSQVSKTKNFTLTAEATVLSEKQTGQAGFGLMLRDDVYINLAAADKTILSNYVAAGFYTTSSATNIIYSRENTALTPSGNTVAALYAANETATLTIERIGQVVNCTVVYKGTTYTETYTDFDFVAKDNDYMYVGMYGTRGTVVNFTNVVLTITGDAIEA